MNLPDDVLHQLVDNIIIESGKHNPTSVKTAIDCSPTIYGPGRGARNENSIQAYWLSVAVLTRKQNVPDILALSDQQTLAPGEAVVAGGGKATWGDQGYYFAENGSFAWGDVQRAVAKAAIEKKFVSSPEVEALPVQRWPS